MTEQLAERQERFDGNFSYGEKTDKDKINQKIMKIVRSLRVKAANRAKEWLLKDGYFNGGMEVTVYHYDDIKTINIQLWLVSFGRPTGNFTGDQFDVLDRPSRRIIEAVTT